MKPINKKPALGWQTNRDATRVLDAVSKAALVDLVLDLVCQDGEASCDAPVSVARLMKHLGPVLERRGDRVPVVAEEVKDVKR